MKYVLYGPPTCMYSPPLPYMEQVSYGPPHEVSSCLMTLMVPHTLYMIPIPYKVWGHKSHEDISQVADLMYMWGNHMIPVSYKVRGDHMYMWGTI